MNSKDGIAASFNKELLNKLDIELNGAAKNKANQMVSNAAFTNKRREGEDRASIRALAEELGVKAGDLSSKSKITETFEHRNPTPKPKANKLVLAGDGRIISAWSCSELRFLVEMKALKRTYKECGKHLNRSASSCFGAIHTHNLYSAILDKQEDLINTIIRRFR